MGYNVKTEAIGEDLVADVLATKQINNQLVKVAFEVQWSSQTLDETEKRQEKYIRDGIRCCWLFKKLPKESEARQDIPMFQLKFDETQKPTVINEQNSFKLFDFITDILSKRFKFCQFYQYKKEQDIRIRFFPVDCWMCHRKHYIYYIDNNSCKTLCGRDFEFMQIDINEPQFIPRIVSKAYECLQTEKAQRQNIKMGKIKARYSKTLRMSYTSFGCPYCDAIFGDHYYFDKICEVESGDIQHIDFETTVNLSLENQNIPHWCYSPTQNFCC